eukprot:9380617-Lingulodinium_polyedra.AAC.1
MPATTRQPDDEDPDPDRLPPDVDLALFVTRHTKARATGASSATHGPPSNMSRASPTRTCCGGCSATARPGRATLRATWGARGPRPGAGT